MKDLNSLSEVCKSMESDIEEIRQELTEIFYENFGIFE